MNESAQVLDGRERAVGGAERWRPPRNPGPGSYRLLGWLGRLGVAGTEPLALALGISERAVQSHVTRLAHEGLVVRTPSASGDGGVQAITRAGARLAAEAGSAGIVSPRSTAPSSARHGWAVSWVAASAEVRGWRWLGPAELRTEDGWRVRRDDGARHFPDLGFVYDGHRIAVEVELHSKAPRRVQTILRGYRGLIDQGALTAVTYVTDRADVTGLIERQRQTAGLNDHLQVGPLDTIVHITRERRTSRPSTEEVA